MTALIHPSAEVSAEAHIGAGTRIWNGVQVREGAVVGEGCILGSGAYIDAGVRIGDRVKIQNDALVYGGTTVESGVFIGPGAILTNDRFPRAVTIEGALAGAADWTVSEIVLRSGCSIGAGAVVVAGTVIGRYATVGAGAVVVRDVPDHALVAGNPAVRIGWVCACGRRLVDAAGRPVRGDHRGDAACAADGSRYAVAGDACTASAASEVGA